MALLLTWQPGGHGSDFTQQGARESPFLITRPRTKGCMTKLTEIRTFPGKPLPPKDGCVLLGPQAPTAGTGVGGSGTYALS